jgi:hypothetical protein
VDEPLAEVGVDEPLAEDASSVVGINSRVRDHKTISTLIITILIPYMLVLNAAALSLILSIVSNKIKND